MRQSLIDQWCEALESGRYRQCRRRLRNPDGFCCLGVLCDIAGEGEWVLEEGNYAYKQGGDSHFTWLPLSLREILIENHNNEWDPEGYLSSLNDKGSSFVEIAKFIRANVKATPASPAS